MSEEAKLNWAFYNRRLRAVNRYRRMKNVYFLPTRIRVHVPLSTGGLMKGVWWIFSIASSIKLLPFICWETCSTSGMNSVWSCPKDIPAFGKALRSLRIWGGSSFFIGNHDIWCGDYLTKECGVIVHREPLTVEIYGKEFHLAHGDDWAIPIISSNCWRRLFSQYDLAETFLCIASPLECVELGLTWAKHSRQKRMDGKEPDYMGEDKEYLVLYTKEYLKSHPTINFFLYGHRHIELDLMLSAYCPCVDLGDRFYFSYAVFDGENLFLENSCRVAKRKFSLSENRLSACLREMLKGGLLYIKRCIMPTVNILPLYDTFGNLRVVDLFLRTVESRLRWRIPNISGGVSSAYPAHHGYFVHHFLAQAAIGRFWVQAFVAHIPPCVWWMTFQIRRAASSPVPNETGSSFQNPIFSPRNALLYPPKSPCYLSFFSIRWCDETVHRQTAFDIAVLLCSARICLFPSRYHRFRGRR